MFSDFSHCTWANLPDVLPLYMSHPVLASDCLQTIAYALASTYGRTIVDEVASMGVLIHHPITYALASVKGETTVDELASMRVLIHHPIADALASAQHVIILHGLASTRHNTPPHG